MSAATKTLILPTLALCALAAFPAAQADESMRCGKWVVTSEVSVSELIAKCGAPASKEVSTQDLYGPGAQPGRTRKAGVSTTERWTYDRGSRSFRMIVTIVDGKVASIDRAG